MEGKNDTPLESEKVEKVVSVSVEKNEKKKEIKETANEDFDKVQAEEEDQDEDVDEKPLKAIIVGAGQRANVYSTFAKKNPSLLKIVAVADPNQYRRERMALIHLIPFERLYMSWVCLPEVKIADIAIICTLDNLRFDVVNAFADKGYAIILEKPMGPSYSECKRIHKVLQENNCTAAIAHVLRFDPHVFKILEVLEMGVVGEVVSIHHTHPVGWFHFAHSHVRGKWANVTKSSTLLVNKCCHDIEFIRALMPEVAVKLLYSSGSLNHFREENRPAGAGKTCIGCCEEDTCPFSATRIYLNKSKEGFKGWPLNEITEFPDNDTITEALLGGPYGKCVYEQLNDVVDNQEVVMQFENGVTATLSVSAFTQKVGVRRTVIRGSHGELTCNFDESFVRFYNFTKEDEFLYHIQPTTDNVSSASMVSSRDADTAFILSFLTAVKSNTQIGLLTSYKDSLETYLLLFAAEHARLTNKLLNPSQVEAFLE